METSTQEIADVLLRLEEPFDKDEVKWLVAATSRDGRKGLLLPKEEMAGGRPITPLHGGHVRLLCTAGLLNGVFGQGVDRHIARWRSVKHVTTFEVKQQGSKEIHKRERFSHALALVSKDDRT